VTNDNAGTMSRIDPRSRTVVETIPVGSTPSGVAVGDGAVWVTDNLSQTVSRIDPAVDRVVQTIPVGNAPEGVAVGDGSVWVANSSDGTISRIDSVRGDVVDTIAFGGGATDVAAGAGAVWVSDETGDRVFRVNPQDDQVTASINVGTGPTAIATGFGSVWVANSLDGTVSRIDPQTNSVTATVAAGDGAGGIAAGAGGVWVASEYAGTLSLINPATNVLERTITAGGRPQGVALAQGLVWVGVGPADTSHRGGTLTVLATGHADTVDPLLTQNLYDLLPLSYDGLTAYQRVGGSGSVQLVPDLAVSLPSPTDGGTTYTFQLRRGIRYSNGEPLRPEDFRRALERDLILGGNTNYGAPFADVIGGAACAPHPSHCDLTRGVVTDDAADTVTFHLVEPNPEFLDRLTLPDAYPVPAGIPNHGIGFHPMPDTGAYEWVDASRDRLTLVRNPYFHEWSHAARPDGYPDKIVIQGNVNWEAGITAVERGTADYMVDGVPADRLAEAQTRFASQLYITPTSLIEGLILNTRTAPFTDILVRQAINYAVDRGKIAALLGEDSQPACQILPVGLPGYRRYCPYTTDPGPAGIWHAPNLPEAEHLIDASHTRGTPVTIWNLDEQDLAPADHYLVSLLDRLGYPTHIKNFSDSDPTGPPRVADSRTGVQAALYDIPIGGLLFPSAAQVLQIDFACRSFVPHSIANSNWSEFCDHRLDSQIDNALDAESNNAPNTAALWAQADQTATNQAPAVPLTTTTDIHLVSARVGNYQYSFAQGVLLDQLWVH
jgi:peptide/nickel transport system substrate-binding protein